MLYAKLVTELTYKGTILPIDLCTVFKLRNLSMLDIGCYVESMQMTVRAHLS